MALCAENKMTFTKCPRCNESFHLRLTSEAALRELREKEKVGENLCFGCFKEIKEYDVVKVIQKNDSVPEAEIDDEGAVLMVLNGKDGTRAYEVESVLPDGSNKWLGTFARYQLKWVSS